MLRLNIDDSSLVLDNQPTNWGGGVILYNGNPFTGILFEYYPNSTQLSSESEYKDGIPDGRQVEYWPNGNLKEECFQKYDYYIGSFKLWNDQGVLISHQEFDEFGNWKKTLVQL